MILRKPYAFIIKHFRIIHLLLLLPMLYLVFKTKAIITFLGSYINNGYALSSDIVLESLTSKYINVFMFLAVIIILGVIVLLAFILQNKNKPTKFYNVSIVYYVVLLIALTGCFSILELIKADMLDNSLARIARDLAIVVHYSQYIFIIFTIIRGVGFDVKRFDFKSDLEDLQISSEDNEEFEFLVGKDTYKTKRTIRRFFRELKYYYQENKFIFTVIFLILIVVLGSFIYMNKQVKEKVYKETETLSFGNLYLTINDSYVSYVSLSGQNIESNKAYIILQLKVANRYRENQIFNYGNLQLVSNNKRITPNLSLGNYFIDLGSPFKTNQVSGNSEFDGILVYEIDKKDVSSSYNLETYYAYDSTAKENSIKNHTIKINPSIISDSIQTNSVNPGALVNLDGTHLGKTNFTLKNYELMNRYTYDINGVTNEIYIDLIQDSNKTLMIIDYDLTLDETSDYMKSNKNYQTFFEDFMHLEYKVDNKNYKSDIELINPSNYSDKLIFKVNNNILNASNIEAIVTVRNVSYRFKLK